MIKRPLNKKFTAAVLEGRKVTTIRDSQWPVGTQIMLYNWSGKPYRSKHVDVASIIVTGTCPILINREKDGLMKYAYDLGYPRPLWQKEGFDFREDMDAWFRALVKPGQCIIRNLMVFHKVAGA